MTALVYLAFLLCQPEIDLAVEHPGLYRMFYLPAPTKEMKDLVNKDLGDDEWKTRETGSAKLKEMGWKALAALEIGMKNDDLEIRTRCRRARETLLGFYVESYPSIFKFDKTEFKSAATGKKFRIDPALAERIYRECWEKHKVEQMKANGWVRDDSVYDSEVGPKATRKLVHALILMGVDKDDLKKTLEAVEKNDMKLPESLREYEGVCGMGGVMVPPRPLLNPIRLRLPPKLPFGR